MHNLKQSIVLSQYLISSLATRLTTLVTLPHTVRLVRCVTTPYEQLALRKGRMRADTEVDRPNSKIYAPVMVCRYADSCIAICWLGLLRTAAELLTAGSMKDM